MVHVFFLLPLLALAGVIQHDVSTTERSEFSFSTVCSKMVPFETPLIEPVSGTILDCMGKKIDVGDFCGKELAHDPYFLRGHIDAGSKKVVCHSGKKVLFKYQCVKISDRELCSKDAVTSCRTIRHKLARRLDIVHSSFTKNPKGIKELNCYFESLPLSEKSHGRL